MPRARAGGSAGTARRAADVRPEGSATAWLLRCAPGLATSLIAELRANGLADRRSKPSVLWQRNHDLVFLPRLAAEPKAGQLRIAEEIHRCPVYGRYKISLRQLDVMAGFVRSKRGHWHLVVTVDGNRYNRHELGRWLGRELRRRGAALDDSGHRTAFLFCVEESYYFCLPYRTATETGQRGQRVAEREGSLPPTIAAAMAFLGEPRDGETVLDPVCGSGTLLAEACAYAPGIHAIGIDSDTDAVAAARRNLAKLRDVTLATGDARATKLPDASVGLFLANLPFGKQFGSRSQNRQLYQDIVREMARLGRAEGWRAVLLTSDTDALEAAAADIGTVRLARASPVKVRGEPATIFLLRPGRSGAGRP